MWLAPVYSVQPVPQCFASTPRLSTICRLDDIVPCDHGGSSDWSADAKAAFVEMTSTRPMKIRVCVFSTVYFATILKARTTELC